jgi:hypothetical protein
MRFQIGLAFEAADVDAAIATVEGLSLPAGTTILGMMTMPEPVAFSGFPQTIAGDGGHPEGIEELPPPTTASGHPLPVDPATGAPAPPAPPAP